jgi:hypothetical protein
MNVNLLIICNYSKIIFGALNTDEIKSALLARVRHGAK